LLWSAECLLQRRDMVSLRSFFDELMENRLALEALPGYLTGFLLALSFTPLMAPLTVELMSKAFARLPDEVLMPWLPKLIMMLRPHAGTALPILLKEAAAIYPASLKGLANWSPPWETCGGLTAKSELLPPAAPAETLTPEQQAVRSLLIAHPSTANALAGILGLDVRWRTPAASDEVLPISGAVAGSPASPSPVGDLLAAHPGCLEAVAAVLKSPL